MSTSIYYLQSTKKYIIISKGDEAAIEKCLSENSKSLLDSTNFKEVNRERADLGLRTMFMAVRFLDYEPAGTDEERQNDQIF